MPCPWLSLSSCLPPFSITALSCSKEATHHQKSQNPDPKSPRTQSPEAQGTWQVRGRAMNRALIPTMFFTSTQQGHHKGRTKKPLSPQHTGTVGDTRTSWGSAVKAVSGYQGFPHQDPLSQEP